MTAPYRLVLGDALDVLKGLEPGSVDAVVTDPPYGTDVPRDGYGRRQLWAASRHIAGDSDLSTMAAVLVEAHRVLAEESWLACFVSPKRHAEAVQVIADAGFTMRGEVVWDKAMPGLGGGIRYQHELVALASKGEPGGLSALFSILRYPRTEAALHPHEKPIGVMKKLVAYCAPEGGTVLDPFMGSGTTGVACAEEGFRFVGVEREPRYYEIAEKRIRQAYSQGRLFA